MRRLALLLLALTFAAVTSAGAATTTFNGHTIHYVDKGSGEPALVLVHGWACDADFWKEQTGPLSRHVRVLAVDLPGHGESDIPETDFTQKYFARAVLAVMDHAGVDAAVVAGHSMGATVARWMATLAPQRVSGLVLVDGAVFLLPAGEAERQAWRQKMQGFAAMFHGPDGEENTAGFIDAMHTESTPAAVRDMARRRMLATPQKVRLAAMEDFLAQRSHDLPPVPAPTLAVYAVSPDTPPDLERQLGTMFPDLRYRLWDGPGHFLQLERPAELNREILAFLKELQRQPRQPPQGHQHSQPAHGTQQAHGASPGRSASSSSSGQQAQP